MLKIENTEVMGWEHAIRGMRNPKNSWEKSDSGYCDAIGDKFGDVIKPENYRLGPNDFDLMSRLRNAGTDHRKFMRMITVYLDITAPLYWWKEFDTYKVGTVANSCSTMHKIADKEFTLDDFSYEHLNCEPYHRDWIESATVDEDITSPHKVWMTPLDILRCTIEMLNAYRESYLETKDKQDWWQMIQLLLDTAHMAKELGDVAWYLAVSANAIGYDLETIMQMNVDKLKARYPDGFDAEHSLHRNQDDI